MGVPRRHSVTEIKAFIPEPDNWVVPYSCHYFRFPLPYLRPYSGKERKQKNEDCGREEIKYIQQ